MGSHIIIIIAGYVQYIIIVVAGSVHHYWAPNISTVQVRNCMQAKHILWDQIIIFYYGICS
jgi:hypothetical protein